MPKTRPTSLLKLFFFWSSGECFSTPISVFYTNRARFGWTAGMQGMIGAIWGDAGGQRGSRALWCQQFKGHSVHAPRNCLKIKVYTFYYVYKKKKLVYYNIIYIYRSTENKSVEVIKVIEGGIIVTL